MEIFRYVPLALALAVFTAYYFAPDGRKAPAGFALRVAAFAVSSVMTAMLFYFFLGRHYEIRYVYENSKNDMIPLYRISAVWAGQSGTLLLWYWLTAAALIALRGVPEKLQRHTYLAVGVVLIMIGVFLAKLYPFERVPGGVAPPDGLGMNPLLLNPWMAIHPPLIFIGYAFTAVPFALAAAGAAARDFSGWVRPARVWTLLAWGFLGLGVCTGAYWAYEVLGWGGFWGWDPVENASIFPWIVLGALTHGMLIQGAGKRFALWNIVMSFASLFMVILATFLVRSGALSAFSVHSFEKSEIYYPLVVSLVAFFIYWAAVTFIAASEIRKPVAAKKAENAALPLGPQLLSWTIVLLLVFLGFVVVGTIFPFISGLILGKQASVQQYYYNSSSFFIAIPLAALLCLCPFIFIKKAGGVGRSLRIALSAAGAVLGIGLLAAAGVNRLLFYPLAALAGALIVSNIIIICHFAGRKKWNVFSYTTHLGVGLIIMGVICSTVGTKMKEVRLLLGDKAQANGYEFSFTDLRPLERTVEVFLNVKGNDAVRNVALEFSKGAPDHEEPGHVDVMLKPAIIRSITGDLYISPKSIEIVRVDNKGASPAQQADTVMINKKSAVKAGAYDLLLEGWKTSKDHQQEMSVTAVLRVSRDGKEETIELPFSPMINNREASEQVKLPDGTSLLIRKIDVGSYSASVQVTMPGETPKPLSGPAVETEPTELPGIIIEVLKKPFIVILWIGMILLCAATFGAILTKRGAAPAQGV